MYQKFSLKLVVNETNPKYNCGRINGLVMLKKFLVDQIDLGSEPEEVFVCLILDIKNIIIGYFEVSRGVLDKALVSPREVFKRIIISNASKVIFAHNHPSGDLEPSKSDIEVCKVLFKCCEIFDIEMLDFIIVSSTSDILSFHELNITNSWGR